ncbi:MAG TPA: thiamine pyrophosphate-binding protein [Stellaceae bacterium]|nr:thiamine pyrophosphate-binding protein [Stellaceae bacterium]
MHNTPATTVGDVVAAVLESHGVELAFGVISVHNMPMLDALHRSGRIRFVPARGEAGAANMADAAARVSGRLAAVFTSTGTGAGNAAGALVEAGTAGTPLLHLTAEIDTPFLGRGFGYLHEAPAQLQMLKAVSKAAFRIARPEDAFAILREAAAIARTAPAGPVSVEIPIDVQRASVALPADLSPLPIAAAAPDPAALDRLAARMAEARRPLLWLGGGARAAGAAVARLAAMGVGVVASGAGRGILSDDHPLSLGVNGGAPPVEKLYETVDFMLVVGSHLRSNETRTYNLKLPAVRARIDVDPATEGRSYPSALFVAGDARLALEGVAQRLEGRLALDPQFAADIAAARRAAEAGLRRTIAPYAPLVDAVAQLMPRDALWVRDITLSNSTWGNRLPVLRSPRASVYAMGGGIGQGLPMAVGAALAGGGRKTVALVGDGGFALSQGELETAAESGADIALILMNDGGYGVIRNMQDNDYGGRRCYADLKGCDFGLLAESLGIPHRRVARIDEFPAAFAAALAVRGLAIVEIDMLAIGPFAARVGGFPPPPEWALKR